MPSSGPGIITERIALLRAGDGSAARVVVERYARRLLGLARRLFGGARLGIADEQDAVTDAFATLFRHARDDADFDLPRDSAGLWRLLAVITRRKVAHLLRDQARRPRPAGGDEDLADLFGDEPTPDEAVAFREETVCRLDRLPADQRRVAELVLEGRAHAEIAARLGCSVKTVARKLAMVRAAWEEAP